MPSRRAILSVLAAALAVGGPAIASAAEDASGPSGTSAPAVFVPNLWDPASPPPKPDLAALKPLLIITGQDDPPFSFTLPDGTPAGFDVDLARAVCGELKVSCKMQARRWDTIVPALEAGAGDAAVASLSITDTAMRVVDFTQPYYRTPARFVASRKAKVEDLRPGTLAGRRVAVVAGTAHAAYLKTFFPRAVAVDLASAADVEAALAKGQVDLAFGDGIGLAGWLNGPVGATCCTFVGGPYMESHFFGEGAGIAVRKGHDDIRRAIDYALWHLARDGTYTDLWLKYFPVSPY